MCGLRRSLLLHRFPKNGKKWYICSSFRMVLTPLAGLPDFVGQGFICLQSAWTRIEQSTLSWVATATHCILHLRWEEDSFFLTFILVHCLFSQVFFFFASLPSGPYLCPVAWLNIVGKYFPCSFALNKFLVLLPLVLFESLALLLILGVSSWPLRERGADLSARASGV